MNIYVVSSGEYSDYTVHCACPTEEDAVKLAERLNRLENNEEGGYGEYGVETLPLVAANIQPAAVLLMGVLIDDEGTETWPRVDEWPEWPWSYDQTPALHWTWVRHEAAEDWTRYDGTVRPGWGKGGYLQVKGRDLEAVRKTYSDLRAQILSDEPLRYQEKAEGGRK